MNEECLMGGVQNGKWVGANAFEKRLKSVQKLSVFILSGAAD